MGIFEKIFGSKKLTPIRTDGDWRLLNGYCPVFTSWSGSIYESELVRSSIDARARHISKLQITLQGTAQPSLRTLLSKAPNDLQSWSQFLYRLSTILDVRNTAFIVPALDKLGRTVGLHTINPVSWELLSVSGEPWIRFKFDNQQRAAIELSRVGILTKFQYRSDLFGENSDALIPTMDLIKIQRQGIAEYAKNSASYRFMANMSNFAFDADLAAERQRFDKENFSEGKGGGVLLFPNTYQNVQQLKTAEFSVGADQMALIQDNVYAYFGVNEKVLQNSTFGDDFAAFYEGAVEPFAVQLSEVMTRMVFSPREQGSGSAITFTANRLQFMTNQDKLQVSSQMLDRGIMSINEVREIWNLGPVEGGDTRIIRGEYYSAKEKTDGGKDNESGE